MRYGRKYLTTCLFKSVGTSGFRSDLDCCIVVEIHQLHWTPGNVGVKSTFSKYSEEWKEAFHSHWLFGAEVAHAGIINKYNRRGRRVKCCDVGESQERKMFARRPWLCMYSLQTFIALYIYTGIYTSRVMSYRYTRKKKKKSNPTRIYYYYILILVYILQT